MQEQTTTAPGENLADVLMEAVTERRRLSYEERQELRRRVSDRLREIVPYTQERDSALDTHLERMVRRLDGGATRHPGMYGNSDGVLTHEEVDVLVLVLQGRTNREIAEEISTARWSRVNVLMGRIMSKLRARNRVHLVARVFAAAALLDEEKSASPDSCGHPSGEASTGMEATARTSDDQHRVEATHAV